jgi:hypothetical protein
MVWSGKRVLGQAGLGSHSKHAILSISSGLLLPTAGIGFASVNWISIWINKGEKGASWR